MKKRKIKIQVKNKKRIILYFIIILFGGILAYYLGALLAKTILDIEASEKREQKPLEEDVNIEDLTTVDTIQEQTLNQILSSYNEMVNEKYQIDERDLEKLENGYQITKEDITFFFQTNDKNLQITVIKYQKETEEIKNVIYKMIQANNDNVSEEEAKTLYDKIINTRETTKDATSSTSEFFQYKGLETSEKIIQEEKKYQFRIGRITQN